MLSPSALAVKEFAEFAIEQRLPSMVSALPVITGGALMSYGADYSENYRKAATYVHQNPQRCQPGSPSHRAAIECRAGYQPENCQRDRAGNSAVTTSASRRSHSVNNRSDLLAPRGECSCRTGELIRRSLVRAHVRGAKNSGGYV